MADAEPTPPPPAGRPARRWRRWALRSALALLALATAAYLLREPLVHPLLVRAVPPIARATAGLEVSLEELHGDWFTRLSIVGLRVEPGGSGRGLRELEVERAEVAFSLPAWAQGETGWLRRVEARGVRAELDLSGPASPAPRSPPGERPSVPSALVEGLPAVSAADVEVHLTLPGERRERVRLERLDLTAPDGARRPFGLEAELLAGTLRAQGELSGEEVTGRLALEGVSLSEVLALSGVRIAADGQATVEAELRVPLDDPLAGSASVELTGERLELDRRPLDVAARLRLAEGVLAAPRVEVRSGTNRLLALDASLPIAALADSDFYERLSGEVELDLRDLAELLAPGRQAPSHRLVVRGRIEPGRATIQRGTFEIPGGSVDLERGEVSFVDDADGRRRLHLALDVNLADLSALDEIVGGGPWAGSLFGSLELDTDAAGFDGSAHLVGDAVVALGVPLGAVVLDANGDRRALAVAHLATEGEVGVLQLSGTYRFDTQGLEDAMLAGAIERLDLLVPALSGTAAIEASASGPWRAPNGRLALQAQDLVVQGRRVDALSLALDASEGRFDVERLDAWAEEQRASARGSATLPWTDPAGSLDLRVDALCLSSGATTLELQEPSRLRADGATLSLSETWLRGSAGDVRASFERTAAEQHALLEVDLVDTAPLLAPLLGPQRVGGWVRARAELDATSGTWLARTSGEAHALRLPWLDVPVRLDWNALLTPAGLEVTELAASGAGRRFLEVRADLPIDPTARPVLAEGPIALQATLDDPPWSLPVFPLAGAAVATSGQLEARVELGGTWRQPSGGVRFDVRDVALVADTTADARALLPAPASARGELALDDGVALESLRIEIPGAARVELRGRAGLPLDAIAWLEGDVDVGSSPLDLVGDLAWTQLDWLARELEGLRRLSGRGEGEVALTGTFDAPSVSGELRVREGNLRLESEVPPLSDLSADLRLEASTVHLERFEALLGAAPLQASGTIDTSTSPPTLEVRLEGDNLLLQRSTNVLLRADAALAASGPLDALTITGDLGLRNGRMTQTIDLLGFLEGGRKPSTTGLQLFSIRDGPLASARLDVRVETRDPFLVRTNMARATMRIALRLTGTGEVPTPAGDIFLDETAVKLPGGLLRFPSGLIRFESSDPFTPQLDLRGEARLLGYDVVVQVSGAYDDPEIVLSSSPPLANDEILALVLTGQPPRGSAGRGEATSTVALYLMQDLFARWTAGGVDSFEDSLFSRFEMASGREISDSGLATIEATYRLADGVLVPSDQLFLVGDRDVYEFYNLGIRLVFRLR